MKGYAVFNVEQVDGLPAHHYARATEDRSTPMTHGYYFLHFVGNPQWLIACIDALGGA